MNTIFYFAIGCAILGGMGVAITNINAGEDTIRRRWIRYYSHIITTLVVVITIFTKIFSILTILIILAGYYEIARAVFKYKNWNFPLLISSMAGYTLIAAGFLFFSFIFNPYFLFSIYLQVVMFDIFRQVILHILKKHLPIPGLSAAKKVESVAGGFLFCVLTAIIVCGMMNVSFFMSLFIGVLTATTAVTGDLLATWFKRKMHVKYYSRLLPGQGGFLDRFDSYMLAGFVYYFLTTTFLKELLTPFLTKG